MSVATERLSKLRRLAYRQAGRAVMCVVHRRGFQGVTIDGDGSPAGRLALASLNLYDERTGRLHPAKAAREIIIDLAGPIAERLASRQRQWRGTGRDVLGAPRAIDLTLELCRSHEAARAYLKYLWLDTRDRLEEEAYWRAVQAVAAELIDRRRLSANQVRRLFREATEHQPAVGR